MNNHLHTLTITQIRDEVPGVKTFVFGDEEAKSIPYQPGQYLTLVAQDGSNEIRRSYSITSAPALQEPLSIGVKRIANGLLSRRLIDQAKVGDKILTAGAAGFFTLPHEMEAYRQVFFWAAGSGITPIFSLLKTLLFEHLHVTVVLVYSNHSPSDTIFLEELKRLSNRFPDRFRIIWLFSNAPRLDQARLHKDLLKKIVRSQAAVSLDQILCYVCGPENYRRLCLYGLREVQVPIKNIRLETFSTTRIPSKVTPPDTEPHQVRLSYKGQNYQLMVTYPDTILQAARKAGISMPYSCEAGKCGNCAALCTKGEVWMSYNEVLTERDLAKGLTLTCVGHPIKGDVELKML